MSLNRVLRYLGGLVIATILLAIILPLAGIPSSKFLPPNVAYAKAAGSAWGRLYSRARTGRSATCATVWRPSPEQAG